MAIKNPERRNEASMCLKFLRTLPVALCAAYLTVTIPSAHAQSGDAKAAPSDPAKESQRRLDEYAEAARLVGGPAGNPECVWLGRRVVSLLWRDDLDTAFRHLDLYDRFGCPGPHIQQAFRCVIRQPPLDPKAPEALSARVHQCWLNPAAPTTTATNPSGSTLMTR